MSPLRELIETKHGEEFLHELNGIMHEILLQEKSANWLMAIMRVATRMQQLLMP